MHLIEFCKLFQADLKDSPLTEFLSVADVLMLRECCKTLYRVFNEKVFRRCVLLNMDDSLRENFWIMQCPFMEMQHELRKRLENRNTDDAQVIERRLHNAAAEIAAAARFDYLVVNQNLADAVASIMAVMAAETARTKRVIETLPEEFGLT